MSVASKIEIQEKLKELTELITKHTETMPSAGLYGGKAGAGLCISYLNTFHPHKKWETIISNLISDSFESIHETISSPTYSIGISGILWNLYHLKSSGLIDADDYFEELISFIGNQMLIYAGDANFDLLHGALGMGFYLLHFQNEATDAYLYELLNQLKMHGISDEHTLKWENNFNVENKKIYNLSLSHGISSIIIFLSKLYEQKRPYANEVRELMTKALNYLLSQKNNPEDDLISLFPNSGELMTSSKNSRLSWCYGDLGIASCFWQAGKVLDEERWKKEAITIMLHACKRKDLIENQVIDAGVCHGTAGIAHVFNRFYWETQHLEFKEAADYWIQETLEMARFDDGLAGYKSWQGEAGWVNEYGLLEGISGIALVLMSHLLEKEPTWDKAFLLS